jgi:hypothetical protein
LAQVFPPDAPCIASIREQLAHVRNIRAGKQFVASGEIATSQQLSVLLESVFWASLRANEGRPTRARLALIEPERSNASIIFADPADCGEATIAKLSPALPQECYLGIGSSGATTRIWGFVHRAYVRDLEILSVEIVEQGVLRVDIGPFRPFAILDGRSNVIHASSGRTLAHFLQKALSKVFPKDDILETQAVWRECLAFDELVRAILADGHGGAILIVPGPTGDWRRSLNPLPYLLKAPDATIPEYIRKELNETHQHFVAVEEIVQAVPTPDLKAQVYNATVQRGNHWMPLDAIRSMASLLAVDGALVLTRDLTLLGFGAKIQFERDTEIRICIFAPSTGDQEVVMRPLEDLGGMRHQSAARFVFANKDTFAVVVSQDRHVSLMYWESKFNAVSVVRNAEWWV